MKTKLLFFLLSLLSLNICAQSIAKPDNGSFDMGNIPYTYTFKTTNLNSFPTSPCNFSPLLGNEVYTFASNIPIPVNDLNAMVSIVENPLPLIAAEPIIQSYLGMYVDFQNDRLVYAGQKSIRLNNNTGGRSVTSITKAFSPNGENRLSYNFRLVMENAHNNQDLIQPTFIVRLLDMDDNIITQECIVAKNSDPIFRKATKSGKSDLVFTDWLCGAIRIPQQYINQSIKYQFMITDCGESGHFGLVYLDNIFLGEKCPPTFGWLDLDLQNGVIQCPSAPFTVCGSFTAPQNSTISNLKLDIQEAGASILNGNLINNAVIDYVNNTFCFTVNPSDFYNNTGIFRFKVYADFITTVSGSSHVYHLEGVSSNPSGDVSTEDCCTNGTFEFDYHSEGFNLIWDDFGGPYILEFYRDDECGNGNPYTGPIVQVQTNNNYINAYDIPYPATPKGCRWRIQTPCGWSQWCCLTINGGISFENTYNIPCIPENAPPSPILIYPNPTDGKMILSNCAESSIIQIYDLKNKEVYRNTSSLDQQGKVNIDISHLPNGNYILLLNNENSFNIIKK